MVLFDKCCCFFRLTTGGMILGWVGAAESLFVMILSIFGLVNVEAIMNHLRNETESYSAQTINETHPSIFRRNHGEMTAEDAMIIERGKFLSPSTFANFEISLPPGMYAVLTLNLIVNCVTLISSLLLITGSIRVSYKRSSLDLDFVTGPDNDELFFAFFLFAAQLNLRFTVVGVRGRLPRFLIARRGLQELRDAALSRERVRRTRHSLGH